MKRWVNVEELSRALSIAKGSSYNFDLDELSKWIEERTERGQNGERDEYGALWALNRKRKGGGTGGASRWGIRR